MALLDTLGQKLITELKRIQAPDALPEKDPGGFVVPGWIATGDGRSIVLSSEMERLIRAIADELRKTSPSLAQSHTVKEWNWLIRGMFGPALVTIDLDDDCAKNSATVIASVQTQLATTPATSDCEHAFGCTLFGNADVAAFEIGPVLFEPRETWLGRKEAAGDVSATTARRLRKWWTGKKLAKRKQGVEATRERDLQDAIADCPYVCSVSTIGLAEEAGRIKAQIAAHMAMAAISLRWEIPSRALSGFRLLVDPPVRRQRSLVFIPGVKTLAGGHMVGMPHGPTISAQEWLSQLTTHKDDFAVMGEAITYYLSATGSSSRPKMMSVLAQAMLWFHEACREEIDLMAVVKFTATLDALAGGGKSGGIKRVVNARLGIKDGSTIRKDGPTLKAAVEEIYSDGRSRTMHGTNDKLGHDWSSTRRLAEAFARLCLITCAAWMAQNPSGDDPAALQKL